MFGFSSSDPAERGLAGDLARLRKVRAVASRPASCRITVHLLHIVSVSLGSNMRAGGDHPASVLPVLLSPDASLYPGDFPKVSNVHGR